MNEITHFSDVLLKHAEGGGVGEHHGCQARLVFLHLKGRRRFFTSAGQAPKTDTLKALRWQLDHGDRAAMRVFSSSHQGPEVRQVDVAVFVHLHHLHLHAGHLSARWVGAVRRLGDQAHLEGK